MKEYGSTAKWIVLVLSMSMLASPCVGKNEAGLVAYYSFDQGSGEVVRDESGNGNNGKILGAKYVRLGDGKGFALRFDTEPACVDCGNSPGLGVGDEVTVELWLRLETIPAEGEIGLVGHGTDSYILSLSSGGCWWYINSTVNSISAELPLNAWIHIVATFDGRELRVYRDGRLESSRHSDSSKINHSAGNLFIRYPLIYGARVAPVQKCLMDEVRIYSRALSHGEVRGRYTKEAREKGKDVTWLDRVKLIPHVYPAFSALLVEVDFSGMQPLPGGTALILDLWHPAKKKVASRYKPAELPESGRLDWLVDLGTAAPGNYKVRAVAKDAQGRQVGIPSAVDVRLSPKPLRPRRGKSEEVLNNLVTELLNAQSPLGLQGRDYRFTNPRDGWVWISSVTEGGPGKVFVTIDSAKEEDAVILQTTREAETMRYLRGGEHFLNVRRKGKLIPRHLTVRSVPEVLFPELGYEPSSYIRGYGPYTWDYLEKVGILNNVNVLIERERKPENATSIEAWKRQGKKLLTYSNLSWLLRQGRPVTPDNAYRCWSEGKGFTGPDLDGVIVDEFSGNSYLDEYPSFADAMKRISRRQELKGRVFYPYCTHMYTSEPASSFIGDVLGSGYKFVEEMYLKEQPTERSAREFLAARLKHSTLRYLEQFPDCQKRMIICLGYFSAPPESLDTNPGVDWRVYLDMQFNLIVSDPVFSGLYGIMCYHSAFADEEVLRWSAKLYRHYCIEGKTEMLSKDPYILPHIRNADFDDGVTGWTLAPAEGGSISAEKRPGYGWLQGRYPRTTEGDRFLRTKRSGNGPNRFSQEIRKLTPGNLYSLKMFTADYGELVSGRSVKQSHAVSISIAGADIVPNKCFREMFGSGDAGHCQGPFNQEDNLWITYHRMVFRAKGTSAELAISDWASGREPGGPIGQELIYNFIQVQPYLED